MKQKKSNEARKKVETSSTFDLSIFDVRYSPVVQKFTEYFSEYALVKNKVKLELYWIKFWIENIQDSEVLDNFEKKAGKIVEIYKKFSYSSYKKIIKFENEVGNELLAIQMFIEDELKKAKLENVIRLASMNCTIEDINNVVYSSMIATGLKEVWIPTAEHLVATIADMQLEKDDIYMLSHKKEDVEELTTLGKELPIYAARLGEILDEIKSIKIAPTVTTVLDQNSPVLSKKFIQEYLELDSDYITNTFDLKVDVWSNISNFNRIVLEFNMDISSIEFFDQTTNTFESSKMDANISNAFFIKLSDNETISNSSYGLRNLILAFGYSIQAIERTIEQISAMRVPEEE